MTRVVRTVSTISIPRQAFSRRTLLVGTSAIALAVATSHGVQARPIGGASGMSSAPTLASDAAAVSAQQAAAMAKQSLQSLTRATQALQAMQAAQNAARAAAQNSSSNVPNGLAPGGMVPDSGLAAIGVSNPVSSWIGASAPTQSSSGGQTIVTVQQTQQKAILNWSNFNVGRNTIAYFNQSAGTAADGSNGWVALNRVNDPSGVPSQILGQIRAEGSVYLINRNGIIFGGTSQVNVNTFVASSLNLFSNDLTASNKRFLTGGIGDLNPANALTNSILLTSDAPGAGDVTIAPGAAIAVGNQGLALIAAPNVHNSGVITAPGGQVALIAGIGVSYDYNFSSLSSNSILGTNDNATTNLRFANYGRLFDADGNDITPVGTLINDGMIFTPRGNITMVGGAVQQNGVAIATTSVAQPGSIVIESLYEVGSAGGNPADELRGGFYTGAVSMGPQAVTAILADSNGVTLPSDATSQAPFQTLPGSASLIQPLPTQGFGIIEIIGQAVDFRSGTLVYAPGQTLSTSTVVLQDPRASVPPIAGAGRILLESGAILDVSGIPGTVLTVDSNLLTVKLAGNELADSPLQQDGFLFGATITVDMGNSGVNPLTGQPWVGTPLANLASYANLVQRSIGQLLVNGGSVYLSANEMVGAPGSIINLTGGYVDYLGGIVHTTVLIGADGHKYSIGSADPNMTYIGIAGQFTVDHAHWGIKEIYSDPLVGGGYYQPEYIQGGNAGLLNISVNAVNGVPNSQSAVDDAGAAVLESTILASSFAGQRQIAGGSLPSNGSFAFTGIEPIEIAAPGSMAAAANLPPNFTAATPMLATADSGYATNVFDSKVLNDPNFKSISLQATNATDRPPQAITEDAGASLIVQPGGSITLAGGPITVNGSLIARSGAINITTSPNPSIVGVSSTLPADIMIGADAVLDVSGFFINDALQPQNPQTPALPINGGSIALVAKVGNSEGGTSPSSPSDGEAVDLTGNITLAKGSLLNLRGGGHVLANGQLQLGSNGVPLGTGGNLTIETYANQSMPLNVDAPLPTRGIVTLDGTIDALGFSGGGTLTMEQAAFQIGGDPSKTPSYGFYFDAAYWGDRGFANFVLSSPLEAKVPDGAIVRLQHRNLVVDPAKGTLIAIAPDPSTFATPGFLTGTQRSPTNLSVTAGLEQVQNNLPVSSGGSDDAVEVGLGAQILGDPGAAISLSSFGMTVVLGTISAPGGSIALAVNTATNSGGLAGALYLGSSSVLDVSGTSIIDPLPASVTTREGVVTPLIGRILAGGTVSLTDAATAILVAPGAFINVSGASGAFDVAQLAPSGGAFSRGGIVFNRQPVWSDAGQVNIAAGTGLLFEGTLVGNAGSAQAAGGILSLTAVSNGVASTNLILVQDAAQAATDANATFSFAAYVPSLRGLGIVAQQIDPRIVDGAILFGADTLNRSGFDNLILTNTTGIVGFSGQVSLTLGGSFVINATGISASNKGNFAFGFNGTNNLPIVNGMASTNGASLSVTAPYIAVNGVSSSGNSLPALAGLASADATLTFNAEQIDLSAFMTLQEIGQATFNSRGDIRLLPAQFLPAGNSLLGYLLTSGSLTFNAADIYPATDTAFVIQATPLRGDPPTTISFGYPAGVSPSSDTPLSAGGTLLVSATNIIQNGEIQAPFGSIILGTSNAANSIRDALGGFNSGFYMAAGTTQSVVLGSGSITSVSANGMVIPFGNTVDQASWLYNPQPNNPGWISNALQSLFGTPLTQAPQGVVTLNGANVAYNSGALVNISGGGDLRAQEWIPGTGGSRDVLSQFNTSFANSVAGQQVSLYPDGRQIYAIVPGYSGKVAPYDATMSQSGMVAGQQVYLVGAPGLAAGYYTLLPAKYATLPGAFRVVVNSGVSNPLVNQAVTLPDGTMEVNGYLSNGFTGARDSSISQFLVQSASVWGRYSQYVSTSANDFFPAYAALHNQATPYVPNDAGRLVLAATTRLTLGGTLKGDAGPDGAGSQVDISAQFIEITGKNQTADAGYLGIGSAALSNLGAASLLIGGTRTTTIDGTVITPTANGVIVANDASDPLTAPEILLVSAPQFQATTIQIDSEGDVASVMTPVANTGLVQFRDGSVVRAEGNPGNAPAAKLILGNSLANLPKLPGTAVSSNASNTATTIANYYKTLDAALGTVVQLSNGAVDTVQLPSQTQIAPGTITVSDTVNPSNPTPFTVTLPGLSGAASGTGAVIEAGAQLSGGNVLTLASTGDVQVQSGASLSGNHVSAMSSSITFVGDGPTPPVSGMVIDASILAQLAQSQSVNLQSYGAIAFDGNVDLRMSGAAGQVLTLGAGEFSSDGGRVTIEAPTLALDNELNAAVPAFALGTGALSIDVGQLLFGNGAKTLTGFGSVSLSASHAMIGQGTGNFDFGSLEVTLQTPVLIAGTGSDQTLTTTGAMAVVASGGPALTSDEVGGAITLQGGSVTVAAPIQAVAGNITLTSSAGDVTITSGGSLIAHGVAKQFFDTVAFASAGLITLSADQGTVNIQPGAVVDFSGAALGGNGGGLSIITTNSAAPIVLGGTLLGSSAPGYSGSIFNLDSSGVVALDNLADIVAAAGITGGIGVHTALGDLVLNRTLSAAQVLLVADGGSVVVNGTIDASGAAGGSIQLYGTGSVNGGVVSGGVMVNGTLLARASDPTQLGGTVEIGTSGQFDPATGTYNTAYGYENVAAANSGTIAIGPNALIDVSGGTRGSLGGGTVLLRAPLLSDGNVNVVLSSSATFRGARSVSLESYAVWSTVDATTGGQHFDGIIDPAGWYGSSGVLLKGTFTDGSGNPLATWDGTTLTNSDGTTHDLTYYLANDFFTPDAPNTDHETFYGYANGNTTTAMPGTLMGFIEMPGFQSVANTAGIANFQRVAGVELDNPVSANVNGGDIKVVSNWNLGALDNSGMPVFRTNGIAPHITFRAGGNVAINASITDGFIAQNGTALVAPGAPLPPVSFVTAQSDYTLALPNFGIAGFDFGGLTFDPATMEIVAPTLLGSPTAKDQYYSAYESYLAEFNNYWNNALKFNVAIGFTFYDQNGTPADAATLAALAAVNLAFSSTDLTKYAHYLSLYEIYVQDYRSYSLSVPAVATLPLAPLAPPNVSVPPQASNADTPSPARVPGNAAPIASMNLAAEASSSSYRIVAGANMQSANPLALAAGVSGNVTVDGHTDISVTSNAGEVIAAPTTVRTGTGSIDIAAAGNFELLDHIAPGVVYTAGTIPAAPANDASSIALGAGAFDNTFGAPPAPGVSTILTSAVNPDNAGNITLTVRGDIIGFQNVIDTLATTGGAASGLSSSPGAFLGQFWLPWLLHNPATPDVAWYVNFGSFDQGIMSIGGNITVRAGGDIRDLGVSLPTTGWLDGSNTLHVTGGGNLVVSAGGSIYSGDFYVGKGAGTIRAGGTIASDFNYQDTQTAYPVQTLLAIQYGTIDVDARQSVDIGGVYNPTYLWTPGIFDGNSGVTSNMPVASYASAFDTNPINYVPYFTSMNGDSGVSIQSTAGSMTFNSLLVQAALFNLGQSTRLFFNNVPTKVGISSLLLPASLKLVAVDGGSRSNMAAGCIRLRRVG
jgi:filamentous hemagglutinin family protein